MTLPTETRQWILREKPQSVPILRGDNTTFTLITAPIPKLQDGQVLLKVHYISNDPAQRTWISPNINKVRFYKSAVNVGEPMRSKGLAEVIDSRATGASNGVFVVTNTDWCEYSVKNWNECQIVEEIPGINLTHYLGAFSFSGLAAYNGLISIGRATKDSLVVISGAAGATGNMAVQIAKKMIGCRKIIGIAGSDEKCRWAERAGCDICVNYKSPTFEQDLEAASKEGVDVYFDNVGGEILNMMLPLMNTFGRIVACGAISMYYDEGSKLVLTNYRDFISSRLTMQGFVSIDFKDTAQETWKILREAAKDGILELGPQHETVVDASFEDVPKIWASMFEGKNIGKLVAKLI
ncbi:hypothetical protein CLAIMM_09161 [Cladophialophora immunda]|nr:hypothetical protein CLAIMM_09161 [Cladophialophora immunda]